MALLNCDIFFDVLGLSTSLTVILPQATTSQIGMTGRAQRLRSSGAVPTARTVRRRTRSGWVRTSIERYVAPLGVAVVMPQVHRSFYTDEAYGNRYWTYLSEELPEIVHSFFRLSRRREDTFVAGLSMGGYGALKWALRYPDRFTAAASCCPAPSISRPGNRTPSGTGAAENMPQQDNRVLDEQMMRRILGDRSVERHGDGGSPCWTRLTPPRHRPCTSAVGPRTRCTPRTRRFVQAAADRDVALVNHFGPGEHDWAYWDAQIQDVLAWLPLSPPPS